MWQSVWLSVLSCGSVCRSCVTVIARLASTHTALVSQSLVGLCFAFPSINQCCCRGGEGLHRAALPLLPDPVQHCMCPVRLAFASAQKMLNDTACDPATGAGAAAERRESGRERPSRRAERTDVEGLNISTHISTQWSLSFSALRVSQQAAYAQRSASAFRKRINGRLI